MKYLHNLQSYHSSHDIVSLSVDPDNSPTCSRVTSNAPQRGIYLSAVFRRMAASCAAAAAVPAEAASVPRAACCRRTLISPPSFALTTSGSAVDTTAATRASAINESQCALACASLSRVLMQPRRIRSRRACSVLPGVPTSTCGTGC